MQRRPVVFKISLLQTHEELEEALFKGREDNQEKPDIILCSISLRSSNHLNRPQDFQGTALVSFVQTRTRCWKGFIIEGRREGYVRPSSSRKVRISKAGLFFGFGMGRWARLDRGTIMQEDLRSRL